MLFRLGRRAIGLVTGFFALLGFVAVPIGERTGYEHLKVALATEEGRNAVDAASKAYVAARDQCWDWAVGRLGQAAAPTAPREGFDASSPIESLNKLPRSQTNAAGSLESLNKSPRHQTNASASREAQTSRRDQALHQGSSELLDSRDGNSMHGERPPRNAR